MSLVSKVKNWRFEYILVVFAPYFRELKKLFYRYGRFFFFETSLVNFITKNGTKRDSNQSSTSETRDITTRP